MKYLLIITNLISLLVLSGCAMGWSRPNTTEAEFYQDKFQCEQQAASAYPVNMMATGVGYQTPMRTSCTSYGNQVNCTTMPGMYTPPAQMDVNATSRAITFRNCLQSKGYEFKIGN